MRKTRQLIPGENPDLANFASARRWLTIYEQRQALLAFDPNPDQQQLEAIAEGVDFWRERVAALSGLELDSDRRVLTIGHGHEVLLTRRELQLLEFLLQHPQRYFADHVLAVRAWGDRLSGDQVRIYVRRLRLKLEGTTWQVVSRRGQGYALERRPLPTNGAAPGARPSPDTIAETLGRARLLLARQNAYLRQAVSAAERLRASLDGSTETS